MGRPHLHWRDRVWLVPPFGLRRRIFWALAGAMLMAGLLTALLSLVWNRPGWPAAAVFIVAVLWAASGRLAFRLVLPLNRLAAVVQRIGEGDLSARAGFVSGRHDEVSRVAAAIDAMAGRIESQIQEERRLMAVVSHELRTPMARIRVLTDLARAGDASALDGIDREVEEVDDLVGNILARSRLEFGTLSRKPVSLPEAAREAIERAGPPEPPLEIEGANAYDAVSADPTLLHRAIANLIDNARRHGGGVALVRVRSGEEGVSVEVLDSGPGFPPTKGDRFRAFAPESGGTRGSGLGLGLNLVKRIAEAHGGRAWAEDRPEGGARVGFETPFAS